MTPGTRLCKKLRVIYQLCPRSRATAAPHKRRRPRRTFDACVIGGRYRVKDTFRAALAARRLPRSSRVRILHLGAAMDDGMARRAQTEMKVNSRYRWFGELPPRRVQQILQRSELCVLSSRMEGGANVISEAVVAGVPLLASRIPGSVGLLGENYPGYFRVGDTVDLAELLRRAEMDRVFLNRLSARCKKLAPLFDPCRETMAWRRLLQEL